MTTNNKKSPVPDPRSLIPILVIPACEPGKGGGHLVRSAALVRELRAMGREAWLYATSSNAGVVLDTMQFDRSWLLAETGLRDKDWQCIILDRFQTPAQMLSRWQKAAPVIGIDEGGKHRSRFDFLIDILPNCEKIAPNITDPSLLPLPKSKPRPSARPETEPLKVLVSFGLEDSAGLGPALAKTLANLQNIEITLLKGKLSQDEGYSSLLIAHCLLKEAIPNLNEHLTDYDLIITHYGLTAFEALYAGVPVLLASPSGYHEKLAKQAGFLTLGSGRENAEKNISALLKNNGTFISFLRDLKEHCAELADKFGLDREPQRSLADLVNSFAPDVSRRCPVCAAALDGRVPARFPERGYLRCKSCGAISMNRINPAPVEYGREYFFEQYKKQYGKTYIEDFPNLTAMAKRRLAVIRKIGSWEQAPTLLDIGCAYGAFLAAAREEGFSAHGIDPAEDAVRYVTQKLGIPAVQGYFPLSPEFEYPQISNSGNSSSFLIPNSSLDIVTLWYVIEHFRDCVPALAEIRKLLKPCGVLAFSTPSFSGISGRSSLKRYLKNSPQDHWTVWSPSVCRKALKKAGFKVKKVIGTGHHPERFPFLGKFAHNRNSLLYMLLLAASKIFALGDTIEVYAVKLPAKP